MKEAASSPELLAAADATVKIPMYGKAESLNVAVATGILLYTLFEKITSNFVDEQNDFGYTKDV